MSEHALILKLADEPGSLHQVSQVFAKHGANVTSLEVVSHSKTTRQLSVEFTLNNGVESVLSDLRDLAVASNVEAISSSATIYGKRIIIMGAGAQVGQVAVGAISEADRHNIRGERISVDTIPLIGEKELSAAIRAVVRLPRVHLIVLAGAIMGGAITEAVKEVREQNVKVVSLNMAGSVPDVVDLVVSDPVQAGIMAVMAIADTAQFDILRQQKRRY
jgi:energy-converting hydrogenase B subunit Q